MKVPRIVAADAICNLGSSWDDIWRRMLAGEQRLVPCSQLSMPVAVDAVVAAIDGLDRQVGEHPMGVGSGYRLAVEVLRRVTGRGDHGLTVFGATNHGESDALTELVALSQNGPAEPRAQRLFAALGHDVMQRHAPTAAGLAANHSTWVYSACSSGLHALGLALARMKAVKNPIGDAVIVAADALSALGVAGFFRAGAFGRRGCAPFDRSSDGLLVGEGAVAVRLAGSCSGQGIAVLGLGMTCDAAHPTQPDPRAAQLERAILKAFGQAGVGPEDVGLVVAHGTGTSGNDHAEAAALRRVFGENGVPVTSVKGMIGHCMGAAGLFNVLAAERALREGLAPAAHPSREPLGGLDLIVGQPRRVDRAKAALVLAAGFGGNNVAAVLRSWSGAAK
jgi:3-oxoacyl-(acyl-carrier-protein) synthase